MIMRMGSNWRKVKGRQEYSRKTVLKMSSQWANFGFRYLYSFNTFFHLGSAAFSIIEI